MPRRELHLSVYDPDWYDARLKAYIDVYEGRDVGIARQSFPDLAPFISDGGTQGARLDLAALHAELKMASRTALQRKQQRVPRLVVRAALSGATSYWLHAADTVHGFYTRLAAVAILRGIGEYVLRFATALVMIPLKCVCSLVCVLASVILMFTVTVGPIVAGVAAGCFVNSWVTAWGAVLTGLLVPACLWYNLFKVEKIFFAWSGIADWTMDKLDDIWT